MKVDINRDYLLKALESIVSVPSPSGFAMKAVECCESMASELGYPSWRNRKGNLCIKVEGERHDRCIGVFTHVDTLGAMVRSINADGTLRITGIGGNMFGTLDGEYCLIHTRGGKTYTGTILCKSPAVHVFPDASTLERKEENMMVRIDEIVHSDNDTKALGIGTGDFVSVDPKFTVTPSGFIKSRYLDDKGSTACSFAMMELMRRKSIVPKCDVIFVISTYEETGVGGSHIPPEITEVIAFDMGCVGLDLAGDETKVSICPLDSSGPYDYGMTDRLIELGKKLKLDYAVDVFPRYASDASTALRGGNDIKAALIGPGVAASHGMERSHVSGLENSIKLLMAYITE